MAGDWIKFRKKLQRDGRVVATARKCNAARVTVLGALVTLWCLADEHCGEDGALIGYTKDDLEREIGVPGILDALPQDWYSTMPDGTPQLPNYQQHNGETAKRRACNADRVTRYRETVTRKRYQRREEKRREERVRARTVFTPPTTAEVAAYCKDRNNGIDPEAFIAYYSARGWKLSSGQMKDWQAAIVTWEKRHNDKPSRKKDREPNYLN